MLVTFSLTFASTGVPVTYFLPLNVSPPVSFCPLVGHNMQLVYINFNSQKQALCSLSLHFKVVH